MIHHPHKARSSYCACLCRFSYLPSHRPSGDSRSTFTPNLPNSLSRTAADVEPTRPQATGLARLLNSAWRYSTTEPSIVISPMYQFCTSLPESAACEASTGCRTTRYIPSADRLGACAKPGRHSEWRVDLRVETQPGLAVLNVLNVKR